MAHPLLEEFCRASTLRPEFFRRVQRVIRTEIQPMLEERETLLVRVADLEAQLAETPKARTKAKATEPVPA
jgi:hypothetical protein